MVSVKTFLADVETVPKQRTRQDKGDEYRDTERNIKNSGTEILIMVMDENILSSMGDLNVAESWRPDQQQGDWIRCNYLCLQSLFELHFSKYPISPAYKDSCSFQYLGSTDDRKVDSSRSDQPQECSIWSFLDCESALSPLCRP